MTTSTPPTPTRERIIDAAMRLFGENGYRGTSVAQIEKAAGLTPGAGGMYHHFRTKEAVLRAGIERHLSRLDALRDIRRLLGGLGDLHAELTMTARYILAELEGEEELLRIMVSEARSRPEIVEAAVEQLVNTTYGEFTGWLRESAGVSEERAEAVASVGLGALMSFRILPSVLRVTAAGVDDETFVATWVEMMHGMLCAK
ncbi:TetR/AcrR family transcriptional regulator [Actinomadura barringtoniae]|uniref:TetR/AcrR family transcriptional regulator n=1 Tax=Actinomadura barringtoniae TaxID=1427535 RepID=A0A939PKC7_9ACTN|nr:TetR/AcrR family transcriptional regulator [Actinomadura barringtoniae]MBO2453718.1 TetR/AcrR family transcriptional regulator [Actinomadura barringtoniae]